VNTESTDIQRMNKRFEERLSAKIKSATKDLLQWKNWLT